MTCIEAERWVFCFAFWERRRKARGRGAYLHCMFACHEYRNYLLIDIIIIIIIRIAPAPPTHIILLLQYYYLLPDPGSHV